MFKKFLAVLVLGLLAAGAWYGARWKAQRGDLHATVIFQSASALETGAPVAEGEKVIGRVTKISSLEGQDAVSIRIDSASRTRILTDSLFSIEGAAGSGKVVVVNGIAVGAPVKDGAVLYAREDRLARWLAKRGEAIAPMMRKMGERASEFAREHELDQFEDQLKEWNARVPEWTKEGEAGFNRKLAAIRQKSDALEKKLRDEKRQAEADQLRAKIDAWLAEVTKKKSEKTETQ